MQGRMTRKHLIVLALCVLLLSGVVSVSCRAHQYKYGNGMSLWDAVHNKPPHEASKKHWQESQPVFNNSVLNEYHLTVKPADWDWLNTHELMEQYVQGNVSFQDNTYEQVGIRYKGSKGSLEFCFSNPEGSQGSGTGNKRLCKKLSIKLNFSKYNEDQRFFGMKKMNLHAMMNDNSMMRECLSYALYRTMGVVVPRCAHAKVFVNGKYQGVYMSVESVDSKFVRTHLDDKDGVLYKEVWPGNGIAATKPEYYMKGVSNHKSSTTEDDIEPIVEFANELYDSKSIHHTKHLLKKYWDVDSLINTLAVATVIDDWDSFFTFFPTDPNHSPSENFLAKASRQEYTHSGESYLNKRRYNHNFYIFQSSDSEELKLIQWDTDITFSEFGPPMALFVGLPSWDVPLCDEEDPEDSKYCTHCVMYAPPEFFDHKNASGIIPGACDKIINTISTTMRDKYLKATWHFLENVFIPEQIKMVMDHWANLVREAHQCDPNYPPGRVIFPDPSMRKISWEDQYEGLKEIIEAERKRALMKSNPVYIPMVPKKQDMRKLYDCVSDCSKWAKSHGVKSLAQCYNICIDGQSPPKPHAFF